MHPTNEYNYLRGALSALRRMMPQRELTFSESLRVAELQATRLLEMAALNGLPVPTELVTELPRISVRYRTLPTSGLSYWDGEQWIVGINRTEPLTRQRFTIFHEFKHIIDHGRTADLYTGGKRHDAAKQAEQAADFFAGCVLVPRRELKAAWGRGVQRPAALAALFDVSPRAIEVRLAQLGLTDDADRRPPIQVERASEPRPRLNWYHRTRSTTDASTRNVVA